MNRPKLDYLFDETQKLSIKYQNEIKKTGEEFNVFAILGLSYYEVRTHTSFIADLLNPSGSHGLGNIFLELFIGMLRDKYSDKWSLNDFYKKGNLSVEKEKPIGPINKDYTEGGYVDLIIFNDRNEQCIVIENKIKAGDQFNQLLRYYNYGKRYAKGFELFYLTLNGRDASNLSTGGILNNSNYKKISYCDDILNWLNKCLCKEEAKENPFVPQTILQYINLIKLLTDKTSYKEMEKEIQNKIAESEDTFNAAKIINEQYNKILYDLIPNKVRSLVFAEWEILTGSKNELLLFAYREYEMYASISEEEEWHLQIWPLKNKKFGDDAANDETLGFIREVMEPKKREFRSFDGNGNYSIWFYPTKSFNDVKIIERLNMLKRKDESGWINQLISETERILNFFVQRILEQPESIRKEIKWNEENMMIKEMTSKVSN